MADSMQCQRPTDGEEENMGGAEAGQYYLDAQNVAGEKVVATPGRAPLFSQVIDAGRVRVAAAPVATHRGLKDEADGITVDVVREGNRVVGIVVACPCGRRTTFDIQYVSAEIKP